MLSYLANPARFRSFARIARPIAGWTAVTLLVTGLPWALAFSPPDYQQGDSVRIMYVHVPAAWMSLAIYTVIAAAGLVSFVWRHPLADVAGKCAAPLGACFTFLALVTGALWGKPTWGTWWVWDARLTSVLVLFFLYLGLMALWRSIDDQTKAARIAGIAAMVGWINVPIIKFSVDWWNSLHQPASVFRPDGPTIDASLLWPLAIMALAYTALFAWLLFVAMEAELDRRRVQVLRDRQIGAAGARPARPAEIPGTGAPA
ncbi:MAG: heme ABC transporter permease [Maricaulaceae bacterium]